MRLKLLAIVAFSLGSLVQVQPLFAETTHSDSHVSNDTKKQDSVGGKTGEKGGIYVVGRGFKKAGSEMEKGFKAAGHGIVKGGKATGHAFQKAGHATKNFFTGKKD